MKSEDIIFCIWCSGNLNLVERIMNDGEVLKYITKDKIKLASTMEKSLSKEIENYEFFLTQYAPIFNVETDAYIATYGVRPEEGIYEFGIYIKNNCWGKRKVYKATKSIIDHAINSLKIDNIYAGHSFKNIEGKSFLEKLGFEYQKDAFNISTCIKHPVYSYKTEVKNEEMCG